MVTVTTGMFTRALEVAFLFFQALADEFAGCFEQFGDDILRPLVGFNPLNPFDLLGIIPALLFAFIGAVDSLFQCLMNTVPLAVLETVKDMIIADIPKDWTYSVMTKREAFINVIETLLDYGPGLLAKYLDVPMVAEFMLRLEKRLGKYRWLRKFLVNPTLDAFVQRGLGLFKKNFIALCVRLVLFGLRLFGFLVLLVTATSFCGFVSENGFRDTLEQKTPRKRIRVAKESIPANGRASIRRRLPGGSKP